MKKSYLVINTYREGYSPKQVNNTMTVRDLLYLLEDYDENTEILLSFDKGYTFGGLRDDMFEELPEENEDE